MVKNKENWHTIKYFDEAGLDWPDVLVKTKAAKSRSEAKRKIKEGAVKLWIGK